MPLDGRHDLGDLGDARHADRGRGVEPLPPRSEIAERADRIPARDQRPHVHRAAQPLREDLRTAVQPHAGPVAVERPAVARIHDRAATGRDDAPNLRVGVRRPEIRDGSAFHGPKGRLAVLLEDPRDRAPVLVFDPLVEIDERGPVPVGEALAHDALAAAGQSDDHDVHRRA